ncbi:glycosyltransferase [Acidipila rosea]|uniref:Glycosyltransferase involved in cell wall biosynthesis n=1 Tax=Acidipila rosea TaxID=768535 RepID=A0A4R1L3V7_9BACT|nr:glycosyltransferase [Acidipila rosea]TCK72732.1 glycosyltransferase involved in cell wall biosynthesis [Acidipila rosea]
MKICLVAAFPPSKRQLNEYSFHIAREIQRHKDVELIILADELEEYEFAVEMEEDDPSKKKRLAELPGFNVVRCWKFGSLTTPMRLLNTIRRLNPDVVWFNLVFSSFGAPSSPFAAFAGLSVPALTRAAGFYTHITLHHIVEHVDLAGTGVRREKIYRIGTNLATRALLKAHSVSVLLSAYRRTLMSKYSAQNILVGTHGTFTTIPSRPDFTKRGNPELRILAFGNWGTYKRLETLMEAFPAVLKNIPNARLIVAGGNHPAAAGYWESVRDAQPAGLPIEFRGYIHQKDVPELFRTSSVLVMPYDSSTGSSGPAHQACEYGVPIVCADIPDFRCMATDDDMAINFYKVGDAKELAEKLTDLLRSPDLQREMSEHNYEAGVQMMMATVARNYLRWFELHKFKRTMAEGEALAQRQQRGMRSWFSRAGKVSSGWTLDADLLPHNPDGNAVGEEVDPTQPEPPPARLTSKSSSLRKPCAEHGKAEKDGYDATGLESAG